ncbi:MAG: ATP-binding protein [Microthrixaceae bacterium]
MSASPGQHRGTIRLRVTLVATFVVALVLAGGAIGLISLQRQQLTTNLDSSLTQRADSLADDLARARPPEVIANSNDEDRAVQLVGSDGGVLAASPNLAGRPPLAPTPPSTGSDDDQPPGQSIATRADLGLGESEYRVLSRRVATGEGQLVLHLAESTDELTDAVQGLALALLAVVPVVVVVLAALVWWLVGRTLRPVEDIRHEVASISGAESHRRVPVPRHDDEIARLASTMNAMLDRIDEASEHQRRFVADASHELRTPLTRMRTELEVDLAQPNRANPMSTHRAVLAEIEELQRMLEGLLFLARSDSGDAPSRTELVDLDDLVLAEVARVRATPELGVALDIAGVSGAQLLGDSDQLVRLVRNLLDNAVRHADSAVRVTLGEMAGQVELTVTDDGPGVPSDARARIFERFGRGDDARARQAGGAGLGLAICRDIARRHGGDIELVDPSPRGGQPGGAQFVVRLPLAEPSPTAQPSQS